LRCKSENEEIGVFNVSMLVSEQYGRSLTAPENFFVTPNEMLYNVENYAGKYALLL
jgi:hypothetical protein